MGDFSLKVAIIGGTGDQGLGLALRFAKAGEVVVIGSREAKKAEDAANLVKDTLKNDKINVTGMANPDAARECKIVLLTVPLQAQMPTLKSIKDELNGKIFIDATVPLETCIRGKATRYVDLWEGSAAERAADFLRDVDTNVVAAFNNISAAALTNIEENVQCDCLISGDDEDAKKEVMELAEKIPDVKAIDCGPLENSKIVEKITPLLINLNIRNKIRSAGIRITGL